MTLTRIRWRLNDPSEENRQRWTAVHILHPGTAATATGAFGVLVPSTDEITLCGRTVPANPYMEDRDTQIPDGVETCVRCRRRQDRLEWR
jgi:hypothetical protein